MRENNEMRIWGEMWENIRENLGWKDERQFVDKNMTWDRYGRQYKMRIADDIWKRKFRGWERENEKEYEIRIWDIRKWERERFQKLRENMRYDKRYLGTLKGTWERIWEMRIGG